jgi:hypothetical protein
VVVPTEYGPAWANSGDEAFAVVEQLVATMASATATIVVSTYERRIFPRSAQPTALVGIVRDNMGNSRTAPSPGKLAPMKTRIMYVELKTGFDNDGPAWIGRVQISKTGRTLSYRDKTLRRIPGGGMRGNHEDVETGDEYWVSGVKRNRANRPWAGTGPVTIDEDVREEYERLIERS